MTIIEHVKKEKITFDLFDLSGIIDACFENVFMHIQKNIFVANVNFGRSCLDPLLADQLTGNRLALSFVIAFKLICSERTFKVHSRKV